MALNPTTTATTTNMFVVVEGRYNRRYNNLRHGNNFSYNFNNRFDSNQVTCNNFIDRILGPGDDIGAANGGVVIPPRGCIITWEEYESIVVNNKWLGIYLIDDDASLNPEFTWNFKVTWTSTGTNTYRRLGKFWNSLTNKCQTIDAMFMRDDPQLAISQFVSGGAFASADRRDYFVSCDPSQYIIFYICYVNPVNGRCPMSETILLIPQCVANEKDNLMMRLFL
ncbi:hypothetical protein ACF0H5_003895 [Mactra antiquata]